MPVGGATATVPAVSGEDTGAGRPVVSVVIPAFSMERWIGSCLESVLAQAEDLEIIVVDDGSLDATVSIAEGTLSGHPLAQVVANRGRKGVCGARNTGLALASSPWVVFLDADDELSAGGISRLLAAADPSCAAVVGGFATIDEQGEEVDGAWESDQRQAFESLGHPPSIGAVELARHNIMGPPGAQLIAVEAAERVGGWDEGESAGGWVEDFEFLMRVAADGPLRIVEDDVMAYRLREGQRSRRPRRRRNVVRARLRSVRRAPRTMRISLGMALARRYGAHGRRRIAGVLRGNGAKAGVNGLADLVLAAAFAVAGPVLALLPAWRPTWQISSPGR